MRDFAVYGMTNVYADLGFWFMARSPHFSVRTLRRSLTVRRYPWTVAGSHDDVRRKAGKAVIQNAPNNFPSAITTASAINGPTSPTIMISR